MKKIDLGQTITILANVGVIAGIIFLGVELQQNNELLKAEAGYNLLQNRLAIRTKIIDQSDLTGLLVKISSGQTLTAAEERESEAYLELNFLQWQWEFQEYLAGRIDDSNMPTAGWRRLFRGEGSGNIPRSMWLAHWGEFKVILAPDFVQWMEQYVISER